MWDNREYYNGLSVLPFSDHSYKQAPFEDCDKETYETMLKSLKNVNLDLINEEEDNTDLKGEIACAGGACELSFE
jgi:ribonucleoside-diphosphate reductase alpha chain